ncbi:MAG: penicillin-binding protein 2 [Flavobacteriaceae bacterium]|jgi:penicillin-binding protein 2
MRRRHKKKKYEITPDEIFLDAYNTPQFDTQQMEGRIEKKISSRSVQIFMGFIGALFVFFIVYVGNIQIKNGNSFYERSLRNTLYREPIFSNRGVITDRAGVRLTWNEEDEEGERFRHYRNGEVFSHLLGYVHYPKRDNNGNYWREDFEGVSGIEGRFNEILNGKNGSILFERNAFGEKISESMTRNAESGKNVVLTLDAELQESFYENMMNVMESEGYEGGAAVMMDIESGELLTLLSIPGFDPDVLSKGSDVDYINGLFNSKYKPFLNRVVSGLYTPGSIVKPFVAFGALAEGIVDPYHKVLSNGQISIPNRYNPDNPTIFKDWKVHGMVDLTDAIAVSSNTYFYSIGGGFGPQEGLGIEKINSYMNLFGIGQKTKSDIGSERDGVVPNPEWKEEIFADGDWRVGDTYNTSIGQYGFLVSPLQMVRAVGGIATKGTLVTPYILKDNQTQNSEFVGEFSEEIWRPIYEGMRKTVLTGSGAIMNHSTFHVAAKTGTAQVAGNTKVNSWSMGFFPYENPKYAYIVMLERAPKTYQRSASFAMSGVIQWMSENRPEFNILLE